MVRAGRDLRDVRQHRHIDGCWVVGHRAISELGVEVDAPAAHGARSRDHTGVARSEARIDRAYIGESDHGDGSKSFSGRAVPELTIIVRPPAHDIARHETRTRMIATGYNLSDALQGRYYPWR